jgi:hypothetical protein
MSRRHRRSHRLEIGPQVAGAQQVLRKQAHVLRPAHCDLVTHPGQLRRVGTLTYQAGNEVHELVAGSFIYLPQGVPHAFRITGTTPARFFGLIQPPVGWVCTTR